MSSYKRNTSAKKRQERLEEIMEKREELGLNNPIIIRYVHYMAGVLHGDFGTS